MRLHQLAKQISVIRYEIAGRFSLLKLVESPHDDEGRLWLHKVGQYRILAKELVPPRYLPNYAVVELHVVNEFNDSVDVGPLSDEAIVLRECDFSENLTRVNVSDQCAADRS